MAPAASPAHQYRVDIREALATRGWRPLGRPDLSAGVAAAIAITAPLVIGALTQHAEIGASIALPAVLMAMPIPTAADLSERARYLLTRGLWITATGVYVALLGNNVWALTPAIALLAVAGVFLPRVGVAAAMSLLLIGITGTAGNEKIPGLLQLVGCLWAAALLLPHWTRSPVAARSDPPETHSPQAASFRHAARVGVVVGGTTVIVAALGRLTDQGHWLVTAVLLTLRPSQTDTAVRSFQRAVGNTIGGLVAALLLIAHLGPLIVALIIGITAALAYSWRPTNYLYWAMASPVLLLLLTDFDKPVPWDAGFVRAGLNIAGGAIAFAASQLLWPSTDDQSH